MPENTEISKRFNPFVTDVVTGDKIGKCIDALLEEKNTITKICPIAGSKTFCSDCTLSTRPT